MIIATKFLFRSTKTPSNDSFCSNASFNLNRKSHNANRVECFALKPNCFLKNILSKHVNNDIGR